jgi:hypothetical protein
MGAFQAGHAGSIPVTRSACFPRSGNKRVTTSAAETLVLLKVSQASAAGGGYYRMLTCEVSRFSSALFVCGGDCYRDQGKALFCRCLRLRCRGTGGDNRGKPTP